MPGTVGKWGQAGGAPSCGRRGHGSPSPVGHSPRAWESRAGHAGLSPSQSIKAAAKEGWEGWGCARSSAPRIPQHPPAAVLSPPGPRRPHSKPEAAQADLHQPQHGAGRWPRPQPWLQGRAGDPVPPGAGSDRVAALAQGAPGPAPPGPSPPAPCRGARQAGLEAVGAGPGGAGGHPLTFPGLSWTAAFPPALCLRGRAARAPPCLPPCRRARCGGMHTGMRVGLRSHHGATFPVPHRRLQAGAAMGGAQCPRDVVLGSPQPAPCTPQCPHGSRSHGVLAWAARTGCVPWVRGLEAGWVQTCSGCTYGVHAGCGATRVPGTPPSRVPQRWARRPRYCCGHSPVRPLKLARLPAPRFYGPICLHRALPPAHKSLGAGRLGGAQCAWP